VTGRDVSPGYLAGQQADAVVIATGATAGTSPIAGLPVFTPDDIIGKGVVPPRRILIAGGDGVGLGLAVFLSGQGAYELTVVEEGARLGRDVNPFYLWGYMRILKEKKVRLLRASRMLGVEGNSARLTGLQGELTVEIDAVISAHREAATPWVAALKGAAGEVFFAGDAKRPRRLNNALHDGYRVGMSL
jgi:2,4-dienoyl-CoA reductase (NADPH2)